MIELENDLLASGVGPDNAVAFYYGPPTVEAELKHFAEPAAHALPHRRLGGVAPGKLRGARLFDTVKHQADRGGVARALDHVDQSAHTLRNAAAHRHAHHRLGQLR